MASKTERQYKRSQRIRLVVCYKYSETGAQKPHVRTGYGVKFITDALRLNAPEQSYGQGNNKRIKNADKAREKTGWQHNSVRR